MKVTAKNNILESYSFSNFFLICSRCLQVIILGRTVWINQIQQIILFDYNSVCAHLRNKHAGYYIVADISLVAIASSENFNIHNRNFRNSTIIMNGTNYF
jgi:hypothetical protein